MSNLSLTNTPVKKINADITLNEYKIIQHFLNESCGIVLTDNKQYLVKNRVTRVLEQFNLASFHELTVAIQVISNARNQKLKAAVVDAMTTNETFWFRDDTQFVELKERIIPTLVAKKNGKIKVWSAACSSGQEPYNISMCAEEVAGNCQIQIIGTDISDTILKEAKAAVYSEMALSRGLDEKIRKRFFQQTEQGYQLTRKVTQKVRFQQFNLLNSYSGLGRFDIIFCRNVLIYFSDEVKRDILTRMASSLEPGGYIFLSSTESMPSGIKEFEVVRDGKARYFQKTVK
ncbi:MAG: protein-glutamate O-methyltransferase CheR [Methylococcales bacterium]|nr:protein-glutamate O-methyltransferase CheR [Methylococcales bacterium]